MDQKLRLGFSQTLASGVHKYQTTASFPEKLATSSSRVATAAPINTKQFSEIFPGEKQEAFPNTLRGRKPAMTHTFHTGSLYSP